MSFEDNLKEFEPVLINMSRKFKIYPLEAEDLAQEMRLRLLEQFGSYNHARPFKQWAIRVCQNKIRDLNRKSKAAKRGNGVIPDNIDDFEDRI